MVMGGDTLVMIMGTMGKGAGTHCRQRCNCVGLPIAANRDAIEH
jgi:hypothetical protein